MKFSSITKGTCSRVINIETEGDTIKEVSFMGGCHGNLQGISRLVEGMEIDEAIEKLSGIRCGMKSTSCPDQLARALSEMKDEL